MLGCIKHITLGMNIVRHIVVAHGSDILVASELGKGTTVTVDLPFGEPESAKAQTDVRAAA